MDRELEEILLYLKVERGLDFTGNHPAMLRRRITGRMSGLGIANLTDYRRHLDRYPGELPNLIDVLTINVSRFFRETLTFEFIADRVLPSIVRRKAVVSDNSLRVWSAGCATGEEPYSVAILISELMRKEELSLNLNLFATDIDDKVLQKAREGLYTFESIRNVKYRLLMSHFTVNAEIFELRPEIRNLVSFSCYDLLDQKTHAPPDSVFGGFDMILCRNVLIYFQVEHQETIFGKLSEALDRNGYLVLGEAETPPIRYRDRFRREFEHCNIYRKIR